ncbi:MAG: tail fiber domain-containing protein [Parcubacteria group bacterium]|nr:MAG: tail fiber domain-containing protein [Parcubacteria group bacterium]
MLKSIFSKNLALCLGVLVMIFSLSYLALAWTDPTLPPPDGNAPSPINVSATTQFKSGSFGVGGLFTADGGSSTTTLIVTAGYVGIGTSNPADPYSPLTVYRNSTSTQFATATDTSVASFIRRYKDLSGEQESIYFSIYLYPRGKTSYLDRTAMFYCPVNLPTRVLQFTNPSDPVLKPNPIIRFNMGEDWLGASTEKLVIEMGKVRVGNSSVPANLQVYGNITATGYIDDYSSSDIRMKKNIEPLGSVIKKLEKINPVTFDWRIEEFKEKDLPEGRQIGMIAQEVEKEFPELVRTGDDGYKSLDYDKLTAVLLEAIKEQQKQIEDLRGEVQELKAQQ